MTSRPNFLFSVWVAPPRSSRTPRLSSARLRVLRIAGGALKECRNEYKIAGVQVMLYALAKTFADCFNCRSRIGVHVAVAAAIRHYAEF